MSVGLITLPAVAARDVLPSVRGEVRAAAEFASVAGLLLSFHADMPACPAIVLSGGRCGLPWPRLAGARVRCDGGCVGRSSQARIDRGGIRA